MNKKKLYNGDCLDLTRNGEDTSHEACSCSWKNFNALYDDMMNNVD